MQRFSSLLLLYLALLSLLSYVCCQEEVHTWGRDDFGQRGAYNSEPIKDSVYMTANGAAHSLYLKYGGIVYSVGNNEYGQLGDDSATSRRVPVHVKLPPNIVIVAAGDYFSLAVASDRKTLYAWGDNRFGQLGDGSFTMSTVPVIVRWTSNPSLRIQDISAGANHVLIRASDNSLWTFGANGFGQLGDGMTTDRATSAMVAIHSSLGVPKTIAAGYYHNLVVTEAGNILVWGSNVHGELGIGSTSHNVTSVQSISLGSSKKAVLITAGQHFSIATTSDNKYFGWGLNSKSQLGVNSSGLAFRTEPGEISVPSYTGEEQPRIIVAGADFVLLVTTNSYGFIYVWGNNEYGQLSPADVRVKLPSLGPVLRDMDIFWISAGRDFSMALTYTMPPWVWAIIAGGAVVGAGAPFVACWFYCRCRYGFDE